jgi:antitoxin (DNA-binding transcriptional repressor) of toxin-antitoxin stability system
MRRTDETIRMTDLRLHLGRHLRRVRAGRTLLVTLSGAPIAEIIPPCFDAALEIRTATRRPSDRRLPPRPRRRTDSVAVLLEDRASRRLPKPHDSPGREQVLAGVGADRAANPLPTPLGTLDALHLATALTWRERVDKPLVMATLDDSLAGAARAFGVQVIGS